MKFIFLILLINENHIDMTKLKILLLITVGFTSSVIAQTVTEVDTNSEPVDFTDPAYFVALIVLPIVLIILGVLFYRRKNSRNKKE